MFSEQLCSVVFHPSTLVAAICDVALVSAPVKGAINSEQSTLYVATEVVMPPGSMESTSKNYDTQYVSVSVGRWQQAKCFTAAGGSAGVTSPAVPMPVYLEIGMQQCFREVS